MAKEKPPGAGAKFATTAQREGGSTKKPANAIRAMMMDTARSVGGGKRCKKLIKTIR